MIKCTMCKKDKTRQHYQGNDLINHENAICKNCRMRHLSKLRCVKCNKKKPGAQFTKLMLCGDNDPICHGCKGELRGHNKTWVKTYTGPIYNRQCLQCDTYFETQSRFIRKCSKCNKNDDTYSMDIYGV